MKRQRVTDQAIDRAEHQVHFDNVADLLKINASYHYAGKKGRRRHERYVKSAEFSFYIGPLGINRSWATTSPDDIPIAVKFSRLGFVLEGGPFPLGLQGFRRLADRLSLYRRAIQTKAREKPEVYTFRMATLLTAICAIPEATPPVVDPCLNAQP